MPDYHDCGNCPAAMGCAGRCARVLQREHEEAERCGQRGLELPISSPEIPDDCSDEVHHG